jgi:hypothetical protein
MTAVYAGTDIPWATDIPDGYDPAAYPGIVPPAPVVTSPGISMDDAVNGATYSTSDKTSGDVSTWDHLNELLNLSANVYAAQRPKSGDTPATPDQSANRTRSTPTPRNSGMALTAVPGSTSWMTWAVLALLVLLGIWFIL